MIGKKVIVKKYGSFYHDIEGIITKESESRVFVKTSFWETYKSMWHPKEYIEEIIITPNTQ